jgi:hypothetical protein
MAHLVQDPDARGVAGSNSQTAYAGDGNGLSRVLR